MRSMVILWYIAEVIHFVLINSSFIGMWVHSVQSFLRKIFRKKK